VPPRLSRRGFTAVELVVVLTIGGLLLAAIVGVLRRQQRFFTSASLLVEQRVSLRDATGILPGELRALAPGSGDVLAVSDSSLEIRATIGAAIACDTIPGGRALALAPARAVAGTPLSAFTATPQPGDVAVVYDHRSPDLASDDAWTPLDIADVSSGTSVCGASPFIDRADAAAPRLILTFASASLLPPTISPGTFVRVLRRVRYRFYRAGTGDWFLGYSEWDGAAYSVVQPVSGPFAPYSRGAASGLALQYLDTAGAPVLAGDDASRIARVSVIARGSVRESIASVTARVVDSQSISVRLRNR
jgi:prepilin-type N-terminal cleavage/methylation domain-containing protein